MRTHEQQEYIQTQQRAAAQAMGDLHVRDGGHLPDDEEVVITWRSPRPKQVERRPALRLRERLANWLKRWAGGEE